MPKLGTVNFTGESGSSYSFSVWDTDSSFNDISAVYALSSRSRKGDGFSHKVAYFGESEQLGTRISDHEKWACANSQGANTVCVHPVSTEQDRMKIETDLIHRYNPPCNKQ